MMGKALNARLTNLQVRSLLFWMKSEGQHPSSLRSQNHKIPSSQLSKIAILSTRFAK